MWKVTINRSPWHREKMLFGGVKILRPRWQGKVLNVESLVEGTARWEEEPKSRDGGNEG